MSLTGLPTCTRCDLHHTRQRVVVGSGPARARLMVVGEAPGRTEDEGGEPFTGRSGQLLTRVIFDEVGLTREEYFITNVVKCRPPHNRPPTTLEQSTCRPWLEAQLVTQRPTVLLCVGNTASRAVLGWRAGVTEVHGQVVEVHGARGLATYHPAAVLRGGPNVEAVFRADLATVKELLA